MPALPVPTDAELEVLARTLETQDIPSKLRCGICDLLAFDTLRLPCCSTNICDKCYENELGEECIICCHKPLDKTLCEPNKPMRITIKALLKRKFNDRAKKQNEAVKSQLVEPVKQKPVVPVNIVQELKNTTAEVKEIAVPSESTRIYTPADLPVQAKPNNVSSMDDVEDQTQNDIPTSPTDDDTEVEIITERVPDNDTEEAQDPSTSTANSSFQPNQLNQMNTMNGMNQMNGMNGMLPMDFASMMAAANSMMPMAGISNMMGLGMMPAMAQMFGGFDSSNMSMNGMNMGGMDNYQNQYNGSGNESWMNNNQGSFGNSAYGNGSFGGYSGYNSYNQMNEQAYANNDFYRGYGRQGFANRRGRRGYYNGGPGRGGYNQGNYQYGRANQEQLYPQQGDQPVLRDAGVDEHKATADAHHHDEALQASFAPGGEHDFDEELGRQHMDTDQDTSEQTSTNNTSMTSKDTESTKLSEDITNEARLDRDAHASDIPSKSENDALKQVSEDIATTDRETQPIQAFVSDKQQSQSVAAADIGVSSVSVSQSNDRAPPALGSISVSSPIESRGMGVLGAPTGPRALREGLPNTGRSGFRYGQVGKPAISSPVVSDYPQNSIIAESKHTTSSISRKKSLSPERRPTNHQSHRRDSNSPHREAKSNGHTEKYRERSRKYSEHEADYDDEQPSRSSRHKHGDYTEDEEVSRRTKHRSRHHNDEGTDTESREQKSTKRSHRDRDDYEDDRHRHSSKRSRRHHDEDASSSSRRRHRERSHSPEHRSSDRDRHTHRRGQQEEHSSYKRSRNEPEAAVVDHDSKHPEEQAETTYSKGRPSAHGTTEEAHHENKRPRHERTFSRQSTTTSTRESSKPSTPLTASFPAAKSAIHRAPGPSNESSRSVFPKQIPTGPRRESVTETISQDRSRAQARTAPEPKPAPTSNGKDPHTLEREARDRERLQREMQRRAFIDVNGGSASKRKGPSTASTRRVTYRFEDEGNVDVRRGEREREAGRW